MSAKNRNSSRGRPRHDEKRQAIRILLSSGMKPTDVHLSTGSSLTIIYQVRRSMAAEAAA